MSIITETVIFLTTEFIIILFLFLFLLTLLIYVWFRYNFTYWSKKGVVGPIPVFPFGNLRDVIKRKKQFFQPYCDCYFDYKHLPYVGMYTFNQPVLSVNDPDLAKLILIQDFDYFTSHGMYPGGPSDPLAGNLFNLHGRAWRTLRSKMSPAFSLGKLRAMYPLVEKIANDGLKYTDHMHLNGGVINFSDFYAKYTMEIVGSVGFGVEIHGIKDSSSEFHLRGQEFFEPQSLYWTAIRALSNFAPNFFDTMRINRISPKIFTFFNNLVQETVQYRLKNNYERNDYLQTLIELKRNGQVNNEAELKETSDRFTFSANDIAANTSLYLFAGYETSATTGPFAAYELARNPHIQKKAREEVQRVLAQHAGQFTYDAQNEMVYINMVIDETMRMYPPMRALFRKCTRDYKLPLGDLVIEKGTRVFVPIAAIQMDPDIFPNPEVFDPERFSPENKAKMHPCHWMPFGEGPRKCLGLRQGYIQAKLALVKILQKYELILDERTAVPPRLKTTCLAYAPETAIWIKLKKI